MHSAEAAATQLLSSQKQLLCFVHLFACFLEVLETENMTSILTLSYIPRPTCYALDPQSLLLRAWMACL